MTKKILLVLLVASAIAVYFFFDLGQYLTLANFKAQQAEIVAAKNANPALYIAGFFIIYVVATGLSIPGAAILTIIAGALFGVVTGTIIVSFASSIGATLAFLGSRYVLRDWVQAKFGERLKPINDGFERDGAFYLFTLRMIPLFPFFVVNLLMGLTKIRTFTYYWVSQIGMLLATIVFVNAGTQIANLKSAKGLLSPTLIASFAALGILPLATKWLVGLLRQNRAEP
jgi:uncharacterized membrane protein YdjX (TVP38/TMEM64 family)